MASERDINGCCELIRWSRGSFLMFLDFTIFIIIYDVFCSVRNYLWYPWPLLLATESWSALYSSKTKTLSAIASNCESCILWSKARHVMSMVVLILQEIACGIFIFFPLILFMLHIFFFDIFLDYIGWIFRYFPWNERSAIFKLNFPDSNKLKKKSCLIKNSHTI